MMCHTIKLMRAPLLETLFGKHVASPILAQDCQHHVLAQAERSHGFKIGDDLQTHDDAHL